MPRRTIYHADIEYLQILDESGNLDVELARGTLGENEVTLSFAADRAEAERIVRAYERFKGANIGLEDVLRPNHNVVALWALHPSDAASQTIRDCLK